jgi:RNA polymerase sigma-70 factor (ECF subfamily)
MTGRAKNSSHSASGPEKTGGASEAESKFNLLLDTYGRLLHNAIARFLPKGLGVQVSDLEQEARIRLWRAISSEREIVNPGSYIYRVAVSVTINAIHQAKARREEQLRLVEDADEPARPVESLAVNPEDSPDAVLERKELGDTIERALAQLPENRRLAVGLYLQGMTTHEIAELMAWSEPKARNLAYRGLKDLRRQLRLQGVGGYR